MLRREKAVVDRIVDGVHAVLLVGEEERELLVARAVLPCGAREGTWLDVTLDGDALVTAAVDEEETERRRARIREKMERLRERGRPSSTS